MAESCFTSYETAVSRMFALGHELAQTPSHKFDLAHMRVLLAALDHPERRFPSVLIAGTNGKGSTAATLASILRASGLKTGLYTSPHLVRINERIRDQRRADQRRRFCPACTGKWIASPNGWWSRARCPGIPAFSK